MDVASLRQPANLYHFLHRKTAKSIRDYLETPDDMTEFLSASTTFLQQQLYKKYDKEKRSHPNDSTKLNIGNSYIMLKNVNLYTDQLLSEMTTDGNVLSFDEILPLPKNEPHLLKKLSKSCYKNYKRWNDRRKLLKKSSSIVRGKNKEEKKWQLVRPDALPDNPMRLNNYFEQKSKGSLLTLLYRPFRKKSNCKTRSKFTLVPNVTQTTIDMNPSNFVEPSFFLPSTSNWLTCQYSTTVSIAESQLIADTESITLKIKKTRRCSSKLSVCDEEFSESCDEI